MSCIVHICTAPPAGITVHCTKEKNVVYYPSRSIVFLTTAGVGIAVVTGALWLDQIQVLV